MQIRYRISASLGVFLLSVLFQMPEFGWADTLSLPGSIRTGVSLHPKVLSAKGELKSARGSVWKSLSPPSPVVRIQNEWVPPGSNISDYGEHTLGIAQSLDFPLVTYLGVKSARHTKQAAYSAYQSAIAEASAEITMAYVEVWIAQRKVVIAESLQRAAARLAGSAEQRYAVGEGTSIERDRLKVQAEQSGRGLQKGVLEATLAKLRLGQLIDRDDDTDFQVSDPGGVDTTTANVSVTGSSSWLVQGAESALRAARAEQSAARLSWLPQIELELFRQKDKIEGRFWGGAIGFTLPLWFTLTGPGNLMSAAGSVEKAKADLEQARRRWHLDWMEATQSFEIAKSRMRSLEQIGLPSSGRAYSASIMAYEVGELGVTDLLASFSEKQAVELDYLDAQREFWWWRTRIDVLKATPDSK